MGIGTCHIKYLQLLTIIGLMLTALVGNAKTWHVNQQKGGKSIKKTLAQTAAYDTVVVHAGLYQEGNIVIDKPLFFIGNGNPILDGQKKFEILSIKSSNVTINGFTIKNSGYGTLDDPGG
ncbi:MAG: nitrous oxide reductase family maturation protein NosD, partial [Bacteroidia bacterium]